MLFHAANCKALYGRAFQIQMEIKSGSNVTYRIQSDEKVLSSLSVVRGNVPNITVTQGMVKQLGPGCHQLTLYASNVVTFPEVSTNLQVCVLEKIAGLQASVLTERNDCQDSPDITVGVSIERGAPVLLLFSLTGDNNSFYETREMNARRGIFNIGCPNQGCEKTETHAKIKMECKGNAEDCNNVVWNIEDPRDEKEWLAETKSCYKEAGKRPLIEKMNGGTEYTVNQKYLDVAKSNGVTVVVTSGKHLRCSKNNEVKSVFLPLGDSHSDYKLIVTATLKNSSFAVSTTITTQVQDSTEATSVDDLKKLMESGLGQLKEQGLVSGAAIAQIFSSVSDKLNSQSDESKKADRQKLREQMLNIMTDTVKEVPSNTPEEVQVMARGLSAVVKKDDELSSSAQEEASLLFVSLSSSLLNVDVDKGEENKKEIHSAASSIVEGASNILGYSTSTSDTEKFAHRVYKYSQAFLTIIFSPSPTLQHVTFRRTSGYTMLDWDNKGCKVGVQTTHLVTQCLCTHLTFFGSSFFVTPNLVDPSRSAELFATFAENPVVVCFVGALFVAYFLVVVWARRKDIQDTAKVKVTVLGDNDPMDEYRYLISVSTGYRRGASTSSQVAITLLGADGNSEPHHLTDPKKCVFERGAVDMFLLTTPFSLGDLQGIRLWHNNSGSHPAWYVGNVVVQDLQTNQKWHFLCNSWLAIDVGDCYLDKVFPVSTEVDLKRFSNLFFMKTTRDFSDGHLWYSVVSRPPSSTFTCVQRVSCCFSLLLCTMLTSIMFYGIPTDPSEQTMDLGHFEFTWQQFMVGVQSSLIMFPTATSNMNSSVTLDIVIKDITRIACSLSKSVKSNIPRTESEFGPGQHVDINAVLSVLEDFVRQNNKTSESTLSKTQPQLPEGSASVHPGTNLEGIQKNSNKTQYLYRQLCHIDKELSLLGPSGFSTPHSYNQALQQVQGMKGFLEDQLFTSSCVGPDDPAQKKLSPADSTDDGPSQKKRVCCHGGLPWWFIFVGWLLVIATSTVAGYFTMLYGLKFGKERSISWLVSMIVSFFQSILVIQPLKVLCLAAFFALVIKKVDEEDFQNVAIVRDDSNTGDCKDQQIVRQDRNLYEPPPPADIEKMKRNKIMEQKAFALLKEILTYMGFMWMLLLVAYGQRDPNAFFLNQHIQTSFGNDILDSMSLGDVFTWANTSLLSNLFGVYPGFITDGNSKLVGNARLRQLRVQKNSCQIAGSMLQHVPDCHAPYSWEAEDMGFYDPGWNHSVMDNISTGTPSPWMYQTQAQLRAYPVWGKMVLYRGGGFVAELGPDLENASRTLEYLFNNTWLDMYTRALFVEFTVYNANVNLFCIITLLLETTAVGAFQFHSELQSVRLYQSTGGLHIFVMAAEIIYLLFILYYMFLQGKLLKEQQWAYFRN
ncbi:polycystic kidney disease protein 1-like 2, partial [Lates japonicus]